MKKPNIKMASKEAKELYLMLLATNKRLTIALSIMVPLLIIDGVRSFLHGHGMAYDLIQLIIKYKDYLFIN